MTTGSDQPAGGGEPKKKEGLLRWAWRWWDRLSSWNDWGQWAWQMLQTKVGATVAAGSASAVAVGTVAVVNPELAARFGLGFEQRPVEVRTVRWAENALVFPIEGVDKAGRKANFDMVLISSDYAWARGSSDQLTKAGAPLSGAEVSAQIFRPEIKQGLGLSSDLIAVGAASAEGERKTEAERAKARARTLASWIRTAGFADRNLWTLSLGQFQANCAAPGATSDTAWQRPFIMVGVRTKQSAVRLDEALANAMTGKANLLSPACYSSFALETAK